MSAVTPSDDCYSRSVDADVQPADSINDELLHVMPALWVNRSSRVQRERYVHQTAAVCRNASDNVRQDLTKKSDDTALLKTVNTSQSSIGQIM